MADKIEIAELFYRMTADNRDLNNKLKKSKKESKSLSERMKKGFDAAKGAAIALAAVGIFKVSKALVDAASEAAEVQNKFDVVFAGLNDTAEETALNLAQNYGLARTESKNLLANTADLLNGFGLSKDASLDLSNGVQQLAVDLASFQNLQGGAARASEILTKGLLGETEGLKSLGIAINQTELKAFAESQGLVFEELSKAEKAQLTYTLALQQSGNALGDYARSSDSFANVQRQISASFDDLKVVLGQEILPIFADVAIIIRDLIQSFTDGISKGGEFRDAFLLLGAVVRKLANLFINQYIAYFNEFKDAIGELASEFGDAESKADILSVVLNTVGAVLAVMLGVVQVNIRVFKLLLKAVINVIKVYKEYFDVAVAVFKALKSRSKEDLQGVVKAFEDVSESQKSLLET
jgi:hypothetical protein